MTGDGSLTHFLSDDFATENRPLSHRGEGTFKGWKGCKSLIVLSFAPVVENLNISSNFIKIKAKETV